MTQFSGENNKSTYGLIYVKIKDRNRSMSGKKQLQRVAALQKQQQREILRCGSYSECFGLKVTCNL